MATTASPIQLSDTMSVSDWVDELRGRGFEWTEDRSVVLELPDQPIVRVASVQYHDSYGELDIYYPANFTFDHDLPAIVMMPGYSDELVRSAMGAPWRALEHAVDWASLLAASGLAAIVYESGSPYFSAREFFPFIAANAEDLHVDAASLGILSISAQANIASMVLSHGEIVGVSGVRAFAIMYGDELSGYVPANDLAMLIVRAGMDLPGVRRDVDTYINRIRGRGFDPVVVDYDEASSFFDLNRNNAETISVLQGVITFFREELL